jgi:hypothetical protein
MMAVNCASAMYGTGNVYIREVHFTLITEEMKYKLDRAVLQKVGESVCLGNSSWNLAFY